MIAECRVTVSAGQITKHESTELVKNQTEAMQHQGFQDLVMAHVKVMMYQHKTIVGCGSKG